MFTERLKILLDALGASNGEIAEFAGIDRSGISRLRSGARIPKQQGATAQKLVNGLFLFADDKNKTDELFSVISCPDTVAPDEIKERISEWLYEGQKKSPASTSGKNKNTQFRHYGAKLNAVMAIADISNARLSKQLHIDASALSRFRNGLRTPKGNKKLADEICRALFERIENCGRMEELISLSNIPRGLIDDRDECYQCFCDWLSDFEPGDNSLAVESLMDNISSVGIGVNTVQIDMPDNAYDDIMEADKRVYLGTDGLRRAVLFFLSSALKNKVRELWLYSDEAMDWMVGDPEFRVKWAMLMRECITRGIRIRIIHNITRELDEMIAAINSWMPLYVSGMIDAYYCKKQTDSRFSHTMFLSPGSACISAFHTEGGESKGIYRYDTEMELLRVHEEEYERLLDMSRKLVRIYRGGEDESPVYSVCGGVTAVCNTLSLATMPEPLLRSVLARNGFEDDRVILSEWERKRSIFMQNLKNGYVHECIFVPEGGASARSNVPIDTAAAEITYTPDEYSKHIKNMLRISEEHATYRFFALPEAPFKNINLYIYENSVMAERLLTPKTKFVFMHPVMREAFAGYANRIKEQYQKDKLTMRRELERLTVSQNRKTRRTQWKTKF